MATPPQKTSTTDPPNNESAVRKVSILKNSPSMDSLHGYDNLGFESPRRRISVNNPDHTELGPVRKKSILHNRDVAMEISNNAECGPVRKKSILKNDGDNGTFCSARTSHIILKHLVFSI